MWEPALTVREACPIPMALVLPPDPPPATNGDQRLLRFDAAEPDGPRLATFQLGRNRLAVPSGTAADGPTISRDLAELPESFDLAEPFGRIREAIEEAQKAVR